MKELLLSFFTFTMSVTPSQFPTIQSTDLDGTETIWVQKNGVDYKLSTDNVKQYGGCDVYCTSLVIPTASVLTLNGTPLTIVAAPGTGYAIQVIAASGKMTYNTTAYTTNGKLQLITDTATKPQTETSANGFLFGTVSRMVAFPLSVPTAVGETQIIENKALQVKVDSANPAAGDSDIEVYCQYRIIQL